MTTSVDDIFLQSLLSVVRERAVSLAHQGYTLEENNADALAVAEKAVSWWNASGRRDTLKRCRDNAIDQTIEKARDAMLDVLASSEARFVISVTTRGALTEDEARALLDEQRCACLTQIESTLNEARAFLTGSSSAV